MAEVKASGLAHIKEGYVDEAVLAAHCIDWNWWVLRVKACIDISVPSASIEVYLLGALIGKCELSPQHTSCKIGGSIDGFKAEVELKLVDSCKLVVVAEVCALGKCKKFEHTLFQWC
jgi:hypothetical protein